jgi:membrane protein YqaA with SNARE-associated domain
LRVATVSREQLTGAETLKWSVISGWLRVTLSTLGGPGILLSAFLDSSFLPLPLVTDLIVMDFSMRRPALMPYYAAMAALGSLAGCIWIYALARKAGEAYYRERHQPAPGSVRKWVQEFPLTSVLLPAVAPFPVPFKPFVIAQGVFRVPVVPFVVGTFVGRGVLFFAEGFLAVRYGAAAKEFVLHQKWASAGMLLALIALALVIRRLSSGREGAQPEIS